jgi:putative PIG3 family NAD(P)H quinone oxidoreductase
MPLSLGHPAPKGYLRPRAAPRKIRTPPMTEPTMRAIAVENGRGPAEALKLVDIPRPMTEPGQILIAVEAAGVNRPDLIQRMGFYPPPPGAPSTLGLEVAGKVTVADGRWKVGDTVCALLGGGGYAEYAVCDARHALPIPMGLSLIEAAALPETVFTVYANVFEHGALQAGETVMIHGATSGIGVAAIQMAKAAGARVIATARGAAKAAQAVEIGADVAIDTSAEDFEAVAKAHGGADVILDMVAGPYFPKNLEALNTGGRLIHIASQGGGTVELPIMKIMQKRLIVTGSTLRPRSADEKARLAGEVERVVWPWIAAGKVRAVIDRIFPLEEAAAAHAYLEHGGHLGKVMLSV